MGKYDKKFKLIDDYELTPSCLLAIANELAEKNRLKRVEIEIEIIKQVDVAQLSTFDYQNEDLA